MKRLLGFTWILLAALGAKAQSIQRLSFVKADSLFTIDSTHWSSYPGNLFFGGISGLEMPGENSLMFVSDRQAPNKVSENQYSWIFLSDTLGNISTSYRFYGVKNVEAIRLDSLKKKIWYSFENEESTGVGFVDSSETPKTIVEFRMANNPFTSDNRGIESIGLASNGLWYVFESGKDSVNFTFLRDFDKDQQNNYSYPFDARSCLLPNQELDGSIGNGITDILVYPNDESRLLVMERCFNGKQAFIKLFETKHNGQFFSKKEVFNWDSTTTFHDKLIKPDNMEGMTWGSKVGDKRTVYIISDDNQSPKRQRTIMLKLIED